MNVGVGLPTTTPGTTGELLLDWARRADEGPFSSLCFGERMAFDNPHALTLLFGPMGSGKSLGVSGWLESRGDEDARWIAADAGWEPARLQEALLAAQEPEAPAPRLVVVDEAHLLPPASARLVNA